MRFLIDMPISPSIVQWLQRQGHNAVHASEIGLSQAPDRKIINQAKKEKRVIVTADLDYPRLLAIAGSREPGLILFRGGNYNEREMLDLIKKVLAVIPAEDLLNSIVVVDRRRIRRRRLPIKYSRNQEPGLNI